MRYRAALHPEFPCPAFRSDHPAPRRDALPGCATPRVPLSRISQRPSRPKAGCATGLRYTPSSLVPHFAATLPPQGGMRYRAALHPEFPCPAFRSDHPAPRRDALPGCATPRVPLSRISQRPSRPKAGCATGLRYTRVPLSRISQRPSRPKAGCATGLRYTPSSLVPHFAATIPPQGGMCYRAALHPEFPCPAFRSDPPAPRRDALPGCATPRNGRECKQRRTADDRKTKSGHGAAFR
jgi:hypothetical protein